MGFGIGLRVWGFRVCVLSLRGMVFGLVDFAVGGWCLASRLVVGWVSGGCGCFLAYTSVVVCPALRWVWVWFGLVLVTVWLVGFLVWLVFVGFGFGLVDDWLLFKVFSGVVGACYCCGWWC